MRSWESLAESSDGLYVPDDFRHAFYQLVVQQALYLRFMHQSVAYRLISTYRTEFKEAAEMLGLRLAFNDRLEYCYVLQDSGRFSPMNLQETMLLLVLRQAYHQRASAGDLTQEGDAVITIPELQELHKQLTTRDLDVGAQALRAQLKDAQRHGLARTVDAPDGDVQPFAVAVMPAIADVLSEHAVGRFGANLKASLMGKEPSEKDAPPREEEVQ
jgi:hypothetical protein